MTQGLASAPSTSAIAGNLRGALWMLASAACFTIMATCLKLLAERGYSESQMLLFRCGVGVVLLAPLALRRRSEVFKVARPWVMARRCIGSAFGILLAFYAFAHMPIATAQALSFARSLFVVILAALLLREQIGVWRRGAVLVGFAGVLVMLRPAEMHFTWAAAAALGSAALMAYTIVTVKDLSRDHSAIALVFWMNAGATIIGLPLAFGGWRTPLGEDLAIFLAMAAVGVLAQSFFTLGLSAGEASLMTMMDYLRMPFAVAASYLVFHQAPDIWTYLGAAIIIASTAVITIRESTRAHRVPPPPS